MLPFRYPNPKVTVWMFRTPVNEAPPLVDLLNRITSE